MRRFSAFAALLMILAAAGCGTTEYHYDVRKDLGVYFANADSVIGEMRRAFAARSAKITINYESGSDNMDDIYPMIDELVLFAMSETDDPREGDYIYQQYGGYRTEYRFEKSGGRYRYTIDVIPEYYTTPAQESIVDEKIREILSELGIGGMNEYERICAVYDYVFTNVKYDKVHKKNPHYHLRSTAYGALVNGCAGCQGYSVLMYRLLREAGINARVITGNALSGNEREYHAWNIVELAGAYYNIDVTWDAQNGTHDYFLKGDSDFSQTHIRDEMYTTEEFRRTYPVSASDHITVTADNS